jgi:hypothetical protein
MEAPPEASGPPEGCAEDTPQPVPLHVEPPAVLPDVSPADMEPAVISEPPAEEAPQLGGAAPPYQPVPDTAAAQGPTHRASSGRTRVAPGWLQLQPGCDASDLPAEVLDAEKPRGAKKSGGAASRPRGPRSRAAVPTAPAATEVAAHAPVAELLPAGEGAAVEGDVAEARVAAAPSAPAETMPAAVAAAGGQAQPSDMPAPQAAAPKAKPPRKRPAPKVQPLPAGLLGPPEDAAEGAAAPPPAKRSRKANRQAAGGAAAAGEAAEAQHPGAPPAVAPAGDAAPGDAMQAEPSGAPAPLQAAAKQKRGRKHTATTAGPPPSDDAAAPPVKPKRNRKPDLRRNHRKKVVVPPGMAGGASEQGASPGGHLASAPPQGSNGSGGKRRSGSRRPRTQVSEVPGIAGGPLAEPQQGAAKRLRVVFADPSDAAAQTRERRTGGRQAAAAEASAGVAPAAPEKPVSGIVTVGYMYHKVSVLRSQDSPLGQADTDLAFLFRAAVTSTVLKRPRSRNPAGPASPPPASRAAKPPRGKCTADMPAVLEDPDVAAAWKQLTHLLPGTDVDQPPLAVVSSPAFISALTDFRRLLGAGMWDPHAVSGGGNARMGTHFGRLLSEPNIDIAQWCTQRPETGSRSRGRRGEGRMEEAAVPGNVAAPPAATPPADVPMPDNVVAPAAAPPAP